jgi:hypothetical protein
MSIKKFESLDWLVKVANNSPNHNRHAAGLYDKKGRLICAANNRYDSHAEHRVISRYFAVDKFRRQKVSYIVIIRVTKSGMNLAKSNPCDKCQVLLNNLNIRVLHS